jgi:hypothetical protein
LYKQVDDWSAFFPKPKSELSYKVSNDVKGTINNKKASENDLRNAVYTYLKYLPKKGFSVPASAATGGSEQVGNFVREKYQESRLSNLLADFDKESNVPDADNTKNMPRVMRGLPVTTTLKPDMAIVRKFDRRDSTDAAASTGRIQKLQ